MHSRGSGFFYRTVRKEEFEDFCSLMLLIFDKNDRMPITMGSSAFSL